MKLYEMYYNFSSLCFGSCYRLTIDRETEKMYYGTVALLGDENFTDKFALNKEKIGKVTERIEGNTVYYRTHLFAETDEDARYKTLKLVSNYLINRVNRMYVDSDLFSAPEKFTLRKGFKSILNYETKFATKCKICGAEVIFEDNGRFFASSDYIGADICRNCMEEHCSTTDCRNCKLGSLPNCKYQSCKTVVLDKSELLECDEKTGRIKVDKKIYNDCFVPNSYILIRFGGTDIKKQYMLIFEDNEAIYMKDTDNQFSTCNC